MNLFFFTCEVNCSRDIVLQKMQFATVLIKKNGEKSTRKPNKPKGFKEENDQQKVFRKQQGKAELDSNQITDRKWLSNLH